MTTVQINRVNTDQVSLELMQTGASETSVNLRHNLLDDKLNYMFAVNSLCVPLNNAPINPVSGTEELFRVERRNVGHSQMTQAQLDSLIADASVSVFSVYENKRMYDVASLIRDLSSFARGFNQSMTLEGIEDLRLYGGFHDAISAAAAEIAPLEILPAMTVQELSIHGAYAFLKMEVSADGRLEILGTPNFWNNFVLKFTTYGAALLGYTDEVVDTYIARTVDNFGDVVSDWFDPAQGNLIYIGSNQQEIIITAKHPLYQSADQRVKISVDSHLPMSGNIQIIDQVESVDRMICEKFFESHLEASTTYDENGRFQNRTLKSQIYSGQYSFIKKSDRTIEWFRLLTSYEIRYFRFHLYIWNRMWVDNKWKLVQKRLVVPNNKFWILSLKFVSEA